MVPLNLSFKNTVDTSHSHDSMLQSTAFFYIFHFIHLVFPILPYSFIQSLEFIRFSLPFIHPVFPLHSSSLSYSYIQYLSFIHPVIPIHSSGLSYFIYLVFLIFAIQSIPNPHLPPINPKMQSQPQNCNKINPKLQSQTQNCNPIKSQTPSNQSQTEIQSFKLQSWTPNCTPIIP